MEEITALRDEVQKLRTENESVTGDLEKANESLDKTRKINSDLLNRVSINVPSEQPEEEDTFENLVQQAIDKFKLRKE